MVTRCWTPTPAYAPAAHSEPSFVSLSTSCSFTSRTPEGCGFIDEATGRLKICTWLPNSSAKKCDPDQGHQTAKGDILLPLCLQVIRHCRRYTVCCKNVLSSSLRSFCLEDDNLVIFQIKLQEFILAVLHRCH